MDMEFRENLAYAILDVCAETGVYTADTPQAVYQLKVMADMGLVAIESGPDGKSVRISLIKEAGQRILRQYRSRLTSGADATVEDARLAHEEFKLVYDTMISETRSFEKVMWLILSGGVTGCWLVSKWYLEKAGLEHFIDLKKMALAAVLWFFAMLALMGSNFCSMKAHKSYLTELGKGNWSGGWRSRWGVATVYANAIAVGLTILGFGAVVWEIICKTF